MHINTWATARFAALALAIIILYPAISAATPLPRQNILLAGALSVDPVANTVVLPLHRGISQGRTVWYIVTDSSDRDDAGRRGVVYAPLMAYVDVLQEVTQTGGALAFPAAPDFAPRREFQAGPTGFPPQAARPGAVAETGYSPFIRLPGSPIVLNAPIIAIGDGPFDVVTHADTADRVLAIDLISRTATLLLSHGFAGGKPVVYISTEASDPVAAALERAIYNPSLAASDGDIGVIAFANGQTGRDNPKAQGLGFLSLDGGAETEATSASAASLGSPGNIFLAFPTGRTAPNYSPLWNVQMGVWSNATVSAGENLVQRDAADVARLVREGRVAGVEGKPFGSVGILVNCAVIAYLVDPP